MDNQTVEEAFGGRIVAALQREWPEVSPWTQVVRVDQLKGDPNAWRQLKNAQDASSIYLVSYARTLDALYVVTSEAWATWLNEGLNENETEIAELERQIRTAEARIGELKERRRIFKDSLNRLNEKRF